MADLATLGISARLTGVNEASRALDGLSDSAGKAEGSARSFGEGVASSESPVRSLQGALGGLSGALSALGVAFSVKYVADLADSWSDIRSQVGQAIGDINGASEVMDRLSQTARQTYSSLELTATGFVRNATVLRELGLTTQQQLDYQESLNNALVVSGARGRAAEFVQESLNRAMALGAVRGIELNNILNYGGRIAEALAEHFGTTTGGLMKLAQEGKITGAVINEVLTKNLETFREEAERMPATIGDAFQLVRNSILQSVGAFDQAGKVSEGFAGALITVSDNIGVVTKAALALGVVLGARTISGASASIGQYGVSVLNASRATRAAAIDEAATAAARLRNAEAAIATARANGLVTASYRVLSRELLAARTAMGAANAQLAATTVAARTASVAVRGLSTAMSALGGPVGVALIALTGIFYAVSVRTQEAEDRANRYADAIEKAGSASGSAAVGIEKTSEALFKVSEGMSRAAAQTALDAALRSQAQATADLTEEYNKAGRGIAGLSTYFSDVYGPLGDLTKRFNDGKISVEEYVKETDGLAKIDPDMSALIARLQGVAQVLAATRGEANALNSALNSIGSERGGRVRTLSAAELAAQRNREQQEIQDSQVEFSSRFGDNTAVIKALQDQAKELNKVSKEASKAAREAERMKKAYDSILTSAQERLAQIELEEKLIGKTGIASDVMRIKLDALYDAQKKGLTLSSAQISELNGLADAYGKVAERVAALQLMEEARFERAQLFRSPIDQRIAADLRNAGIEMDSVAGQAYASFQKTTEQIRFAKDEVKSFASGFISDILNGKSALEALSGALQKLGDKLIDLALDQAINGLFGNLAGLFGGGGFGTSYSPPAPSSGGIGLFADGGISTKPAIFGEAGPEAAVPLPDGRSIPVTLNSGSGGSDNGNTYAPQYNFTGTSEEFEEFKRFVQERDRQFDARAVNAVNRGSKKNKLRA